jgi:FkbM family methyltransferase
VRESRRKLEELSWVLGVHGAVVNLNRALGRRENSSELKRFYSQLLPKNSLVYDIGANLGQYSEALESAGMRVIAVEPNADCVRHIELTYTNKRIETIHAALGPKSGLASLNLSDERDDTSTMSSDWINMLHKEYAQDPNGFRKITIPMVTLDSLIVHYGLPYYIKIDVEGYESSVLDGLSTQPNVLSFEYHGAKPEGAFECLEKPVFSKDSAFNLTNEAGTAFLFAQPTSRQDLVRALEELSGTLTYRDVYVFVGNK